MFITPRQIRAARGLLGWDYAELCKRTDFHRHTIRNIESGTVQYYTSVFGRSVWVVVAVHNGRKYLKTTADGYEPNNLLSLRDCP